VEKSTPLSKVARQKQTPQSPTKTLLESVEAAKCVSDAKCASEVEHSTVQKPLVTMACQAPSPPVEGPTLSPRPMGVNGLALETANGVALESGGMHKHGLLRRQRTLCTDRTELDIMVSGFTSHDSTVGSVIGRNCKEMQWKVMYDRDAVPIDIKLHVQEHKLHSNEVHIESNGQPIFQGAGLQAKARMTEDFLYKWPFRATIRGINEVNFFEVHLPHFADNVWFPATITSQREDGFFEVRAQEPDANGRIVEIMYPAVHKDTLREAASQKPLAVPENSLMLEVPKQDPLRASLRVANGELVTHHFGRPSPPVASTKQLPELALKVSKDRSKVTANVGHSKLTHFVSGEVRAMNFDVERLSHSWTVQIGPFAQHTVQILKKHTLGKIVTLMVDGEVLVESSAADIGCEGKEWQCQFRFVGERVLDFEVYKTNTDGAPLDETDHVKEKRRYVHECSVTIPNDWNFGTAHFFIDGIPFNELPVEPQEREESTLTMDPLAMQQIYGIATPYKVDKNAPSNIMVLAHHVFVKADDSRKAAGGFFARCCDCNSVLKDEAKQQ